MTEVYEYDGPTAWADMTAVEKMEAWLRGDVAECDEREVFRQAIREAGDERAYRTGLVRENAGLQVKLAESQAEVSRLRAALVPSGLQVADSYMTDTQRAIDSAYVGGWNACRDAMLAAQAQGVGHD